MSRSEALSFCRICMGSCGMVVTLDEERRLVDIRADREDPQTLGFACFKGLRAVEAHYSANRVLRPLKRMPDGAFAEIGIEQALDEIAERLAAIRKAHGPEAIAGYKGGGGFFTSSAVTLLIEWLQALGSPKAYSSATIDQSAKMVTAGRIGLWPPGKPTIAQCEVLMLLGTNPLVSQNPPFDVRNPVKRMKEAKARGMKLIVIDPRRTETAQFADLLIQPLPGEDVSVLAAILHIILANGWEDREFCEANVADLETLRTAVAPFTPAYAAARADVKAKDLVEAARLFAASGLNGIAGSSTGPDMGPFSNLAAHLIEAINVVCGRFLRAGDPVPNPGAILPRYPRRAQAIPAPRWWDHGPKSRIDGSGMLAEEMMTGVLADEILTPGEGQVRALIVHGGNPASSVPDQRKIVRALRSLDLLVCIEPTMSVTAELADYILPPYMQYERPDLPFWLYEYMIYQDEAYTRYTPAVAAPPEGAALVHDHEIFWGLAKRLGIPLTWRGVPLDMETSPSVDDMLAIAAKDAPVSLDEIKRHPRGLIVDGEPQYVEPAEPGWTGRFTVMPDDVRAELDAARREGEQNEDGRFFYRLAVRRLRETFNSVGRDLPTTRKRVPYNRAYMNPDDLAVLSIGAGDEVEISSARGSVVAVAESDATLRRRVVTLAHGFGGLPDAASNRGYYQDGVSTNLLLDDERRETINAMPQMTGIRIALRRAGRVKVSHQRPSS
ncbi:molybdopterin-containing oxidoreductase family protein [Flavisphingomonas formosensis]|uniref:molybdopterin-containing oxidoreductase family protein n=1 Tax=Flavisphingomonas formosensis TaxID=861534 RepID=UPI0012FC3F23|nr:molybdopterin-dependent oxidoreductase [Sphingomonas formosensis]